MKFKDRPTESYVIMSPLKGHLLNDGKPMARTKIFRKLKWSGDDEGIVEEFMTDDDGVFDIPAHEESLSIGKLSQFVGHAELYIEHEGKREDIWYSAKMHKDLNSEFDAPPEDLVCDLAASELRVEINYGMCLTKCRWSNMPKGGADEY